MDDSELGRQVGVAMTAIFGDDAAPTLSGAAIRAGQPAGSRRAVVVVSAAACAVLVVAAVVVVQIIRSRHGTYERPGARPTSNGPTATAPLLTPDRVERLDQLAFHYPASLRKVPPGGPPTPGPASIEEYLTNAAVVHGCAVRPPRGFSPRRCSQPIRTLRPSQVLVAISEGTLEWPPGTPIHVVGGHRRSLQYGKVTSSATAVIDCPTGATNYLQMTIDTLPASGEPASPRRAMFGGYAIYACVNSPTMTTPATIRHMIDTVRITPA